MKTYLKKFLNIASIIFSINGYAQFKVINTNSNYNRLKKISIINDNIILCGSRDFLMKCVGNCDTLYPINNPSLPTNYTMGFERKDNDTLFLISTNANSNIGYFYRSNDSGANWQLMFSRSNMLFNSLSMKNNRYGIIAGWLGTNFITTDGGYTWERDSTGVFDGFSNIENIGDSTFMMLSTGFLTKTINLFQTWENSNGFGFYDPSGLHILNKDTLMICATGNAQNNKSMMSYSINGGLNWIKIEYSTGIYFNDIFFKNKNEGYIVGYKFLGVNKGIILKTTDFGQTFTEIVTPYNVELSKIEFINDSIALLGGANGLLVQWNTNIPITTSIEKIYSHTNNFLVYPNPTTNNLTIENNISNSTIEQIFIQNSLGQIVKEFQNLKFVAGKININIQNLEAGFYFINCINKNDEIETLKFIKSN